MSEYETGRGRYELWYQRGVKKERLAALLSIIERHVLAVVGASVSLADCSSWSREAPVESAYRLAASHCFNLVPQYRYLQARPAEKVVYTFESGDQGHGKLETVYQDMLREPWRRAFNRLNTSLQLEQKSHPALQVADLVAFEGWKQRAREWGGDGRPTRYPWSRLSRTIPIEWATLRPMKPSDIMADAVDQLGAPPLIAMKLARFLDPMVGEIPTAPLPYPGWGPQA